MKQLYYLLLLYPIFFYGQDQNYVKSVTYRAEATASIPTPTPEQASVAVTFFDGLGRPIQQVAYKQSGTGKNIITPINYDKLGRQPIDYLPYPSQSDNMSYTDNTSVITSLQSFYTAQNGASDGVFPFAEKRFEASPLNRILEQGAPGSDWQLVPNSSASHTIKIGYTLNSAEDQVRNFKATAGAVSYNNQFFPVTLNDFNTYLAGKLYKNVTTDENGAVTHEFKNQEGQLVLKRNFSDYNTIDEIPQYVNVAHDTYYIYDQYGNLSFVLPPLAKGNPTAGIREGLCYQYRYDYRNRLVEKKIPGKENWDFIIYDKLDRIVATGPANSPFTNSAETGWLFTKYDALGRAIVTGWTPATVNSTSRAALQNVMNGAIHLNESKAGSDVVINSITFRYTNLAWPTTNYHVLTVNYYDSYEYPNPPTIPNSVETQNVFYNAANPPKGMATGSLVRVLTTPASNAVERSHPLYDYKARPIRTYSTNHLGGFTQIDSKIDFEGKPVYTVTYHSYTGTTIKRIRDDYTYTPQGRPFRHLQTIDGEPQELLSDNTYNELGQLKSKLVGGNSNTMLGLQTVDYTYNIRGWLLAINDMDSALLTNDLFSFKLSYNKVENDLNGTILPLYNGNISETFWTTADSKQRKYGYVYDQLNRLNDAIYQNLSTEVADSYNEHIRYDLNGNITDLKRNGYVDGPVPYEIDKLVYSYKTDTNRLTSVTDYSNSTDGFKDGSQVPDDYAYDSNGNMTSDKNKNITSIKYNHLNLPLSIHFSGPTNQGRIFYTYNAIGVKVSKFIDDELAQIQTKTEYLSGGFQYKNSQLEFFPTPEGYVNVTNGKYFNYVYNYTDHLGNMRLSYTFDKQTQSLAVLQENHYYPFGMKHTNYGVSKVEFKEDETGFFALLDPVIRNNYQYKYNGKELQDELGLNLYDYGARNYDPAIGRWMNIDPLAETSRRYSPYAYCLDNPVYFIDPDGMQARDNDWIPDANGNLIAEKDDTYASLAKQLGISESQAVKEYSNKVTESGVPGLDNNHPDGLFNKTFQEGDKVDINNNMTRAIEKSEGTTLSENQSGAERIVDRKNDDYICDQGSAMAQDGVEITPKNAENYGFFSRDNLKQVSNFNGLPIGSGQANIGGVHVVANYVQSKDGTQYVWSKGGFGGKPEILPLKTVVQQYGKTMSDVNYFVKK